MLEPKDLWQCLDSDSPQILGNDELSARGEEQCDSLWVLEQVADLRVWLQKVVAQAFNRSTREAEIGGSLWVQGQSGL